MTKPVKVMFSPPNTFLQFWTIAELKAWIREMEQRSPEWRNKSAPTLGQTRAELRSR